jgi:hypothetical protein
MHSQPRLVRPRVINYTATYANCFRGKQLNDERGGENLETKSKLDSKSTRETKPVWILYVVAHMCDVSSCFNKTGVEDPRGTLHGLREPASARWLVSTAAVIRSHQMIESLHTRTRHGTGGRRPARADLTAVWYHQHIGGVCGWHSSTSIY